MDSLYFVLNSILITLLAIPDRQVVHVFLDKKHLDRFSGKPW